MAHGYLFFAWFLATARTILAMRVTQEFADTEARVQDVLHQLAGAHALDPPSPRVAGGDTLEWMNEIVRKFWPHINGAVNKMLDDTVTPMVNAQLATISSMAPQFAFETFTLGTRTPRFGPIRLYDVSGGGVKVHVNIDYQSDADVKVRLGLIRLGVERLHVSGELVVKLSPLIDELPILGGIGVYFHDIPKIGLVFTGLGHVADLPGVTQLLWSTLNGLISDNMVIPNIIGLPIAEPTQINRALVMTAQPLGMLHVRAVRASNLIASDLHLFRWTTSDPFVQLTCGSTTWVSSVIASTLDPQFLDEDRTEFIVFSQEQTIRAIVMDKDYLTYDDVLGYTPLLTVREARALSRGAPLRLSATDPADPAAGGCTFTLRLSRTHGDDFDVDIPGSPGDSFSVAGCSATACGSSGCASDCIKSGWGQGVNIIQNQRGEEVNYGSCCSERNELVDVAGCLQESSQDRGEIFLHFDWLEVGPPIEDGALTEEVIVAVQILQVEMPWSLAEPIETVALRATIAGGSDVAQVQTTTAGGEHVLAESQSVAAAEERSELVTGIVRRFAAEHVATDVIATATRLTPAQVESIVAGGRAEADPETKTYDVNRVAYFRMGRDAVRADPTLKLEFIDGEGTLIVDYDTTISSSVSATRASPLVLRREGLEILSQIEVTIRALRPSS